MELVIIIPILIVFIVWIVWKLRSDKRVLEKAGLEQAWRIVLNDPHYAHRRQYEEHKREAEAEAQLRKKAEGL